MVFEIKKKIKFVLRNILCWKSSYKCYSYMYVSIEEFEYAICNICNIYYIYITSMDKHMN